ncbi:hypothetical protein TSUD_375330 [Trifolium subterraneum]|uniref:Uncharacterized protein n=1 Tax=Trifolium subterraneum TaxID=3900 RepID=A0A2Z6N0F3_TRISU|nr:hypothetical protein TSUD_375330 [Trifolium subterraneum]
MTRRGLRGRKDVLRGIRPLNRGDGDDDPVGVIVTIVRGTGHRVVGGLGLESRRGKVH